jgi:hypothetical protein
LNHRSSKLAEYITAKFGKKLLGDDKIMAVLHRLDRLTQEEARMTVAQTLEVVQGLVGNMKVVMDGASELIIPSHPPTFIWADGEVSTESIRNALSKFELWASDFV